MRISDWSSDVCSSDLDLGLGRAPGSDGRVAQALRRTLASDERQFPQDVVELQAFLAGDDRLGIRAVPGAGSHLPLWLPGSSLFGAQLPAALGLPDDFASHFAHTALHEALSVPSRQYKRSEELHDTSAAAA